MSKPQIDTNTIKAIESVLAKGERVELLPVKDGVKVIQIKRREVLLAYRDEQGIMKVRR